MKTVVITGANRGIGLATTKVFLDAGWKVIAATRSGQMPVEHEDLSIIAYDQSSPESIARAAEQIPQFDVLINNAAALFDRDDVMIRIDKLRQTLETNLIGLVDFTERLVPKLLPEGHIINVSSRSGALAKDAADDDPDKSDATAYRIAKAALNMYTVSLADRLAAQKIIVSAFSPGWVRTDMGGEQADRDPAEPAKELYDLAVTKVPTGQFWQKGKQRGW